MPELTFYDIPTATRKPWSPNTWKVRYVLNYKSVPYKTQWVEYPDIEGLCKELGAPHTELKPDGREHYTLPMISDPSTNTVLVDSLPIAKYLDKTYPSSQPTLFPAGVEEIQSAFLQTFWSEYGFRLFKLIISRVATSLAPSSQEYFRTTREAKFGVKLEDLNTPENWQELEGALAKLRALYRANEEGGGMVLLGKTITYSDIQVAAVLIWTRVILGEESEDWKRIAAFQDGFWAKFMSQFAQYEGADT